MARVTPVYRLPYVDDPNEVVTGQIERVRFVAIDRQLESLFTFLGDGIIAGWTLEIDPDNDKNVRINRGSGVISSVAAATTGNIIIDDLQVSAKNYIYAKLTGTTPYTAQAEFLSSTAQFESDVYLCLGVAVTDSQGNITLSDECRTELGLINQVVSIISEHVHTGAPGEPSKIDLFNHVKGVLSAANIEDISASKITSGQFNRNRFQISHNDLLDRGTLTHEDLDILIDQLQKINKILFGDVMSANLLQLMISMKHVWQNFDDYMINSAIVIPGLGNNTFLSDNSFIDTNATTAEVDYFNRRIKGLFIEANEIGQITINTLNEWASGVYDPEFVTITDNSRAYGYGYGQSGASNNYFDVIQTNFDVTFDSTDPTFGFPGSLIGWGVSDITGELEFDAAFSPGAYGYGYGWEYATGFPGTLSSTIVTLNPSSASLVVFEEPTTTYQESTNRKEFQPLPNTGSETGIRDFVFRVSNASSNPSAKTRSTTVNDSGPSNMFAFVAGKLVQVTVEDVQSKSDMSAMYVTWEEPFDIRLDNYIFFTLQQQPKDSSTNYEDDFDANWRFDHSMSLYLEFTVDDERYIYQYKENKLSNFQFFDRDVKYFDDQIFTVPINGTTPAEAVVAAEAYVKTGDPEANLVLLGHYNIDDSIDYDSTPSTASTAPQDFSIISQYLTGVILVASNGQKTASSYGSVSSSTQPDSKYLRDRYGPIERIQGQRTLIDESVYEGEGDASGMPVIIDRIYMSGSFGFSSDIERNQISDLSITFPEPVDFTSISWVSEEPSDSLVYIQIEKVGDGNGYLTFPVYTQKGSELLSRAISGLPTDISGYRVSGSDFPESFKNTTKIRLKVVLLPSNDSIVAPTISSITVNYNSQTSGGEFVISTQDQWTNALNEQNLEVSVDGKVSILDFSRTKNMIYGTDGRVVEFNAASGSEWNTANYIYTGTDLPQTASQKLAGITPRISGKVTDLKVLEDSRVAFLDRDSSRVVIAKYDASKLNFDGSTGNLVPDVVIQSEYAWNNTLEDFGKPSYAETATFVAAYFNEELGDNGVLYCVFSHELAAWRNGVITRQNATGDEWNVDPTKFVIRTQGTANDLSNSEQILIADRGVLAFVLDGETSNLIKSLGSPNIDMNFDPTASASVVGEYNVGPDTAVRFRVDTNSVALISRIELPITKVGRVSPARSTGDYNLIFAPIQTIVAFDFDDNQNMYFLKERRPYSWDTDENGFNKATEPWFGRVQTTSYWNGWDQTQNNIDDPVFQDLEPSYFTNNIFGDQGSIEFIDPFLLICITGFKGVYLTQAETGASGVVYDSPQVIPIPNDGTYPMSARLDKANLTGGSSPDYSGIYVALSDLNASSTSNSRSRVIRLEDDGETVVWEWGEEDPLVPGTKFASVVNDVRVLEYGENNAIIVST